MSKNKLPKDFRIRRIEECVDPILINHVYHLVLERWQGGFFRKSKMRWVEKARTRLGLRGIDPGDQKREDLKKLAREISKGEK